MQFDLWMVWALLSNNGCNATHQGWGRKKTLPGMRLAPNHSYWEQCGDYHWSQKASFWSYIFSILWEKM